MKILVWGLGHAGSVWAAGLAALGHDVAGVDPDPERSRALLRGADLLREEGLAALVAEALSSGRLRIFERADGLVSSRDVSFICVGTTGPDGRHSAANVLDVAAVLGRELSLSHAPHVVAIRSTVEVGFTRNTFVPALERHAGRRAGADFPVAVVPELLREGHAVADFRSPSTVVIGAEDAGAVAVLGRAVSALGAPIVVVTPEEAELFKLANNAYHALKAGFANEISRIAAGSKLAPDRILDLVAAHQRHAAPSAYLRAGFAFGGSCLPRDIASLVARAGDTGVDIPILRSVLPSNDAHLAALHSRLSALGARRVGVAGLVFKPGTGDLRGSAALRLVRLLRDDGFAVLVHDPEVDRAALARARSLVAALVPDLAEVLRVDADEFVRDVDVVVATHGAPSLDPVFRACALAARPFVRPGA